MNFKSSTIQSSESGSIPIAWSNRHPVLVWTIAWGITGIALYVSGVFNEPRTGPLWIALAGGAVSWAIAGGLTFPIMSRGSLQRWNLTISIIWALAYLVSFALAGFLINWYPLRDTLTGILIALVGWSAGAAIGAFISTWLASAPPRVRRSAIIAGIWLLGFFIGSAIVFVIGFYSAELAKIFVGFLIGVPAALILGFGLGSALGGCVASAIAIRGVRVVTQFR